MWVRPEDRIVDTGKPLVVLSVQPSFFLLECVDGWFSLDLQVVLLEKVANYFVVVVVRADMQKGAILGIRDFVDDG